MAIIVYATLGLSWWNSLDWCGLGAWGSMKQVNYGSWTLLKSVLGRWRENVNHGTHQSFLLRGSPRNPSLPSPPPFGRVLGLVSIYSSHSFKPQLFFSVSQGGQCVHSPSVLSLPTAACSIGGSSSLHYHVSIPLAVLYVVSLSSVV